MTAFKKLMLALTLLSASAAGQASEGSLMTLGGERIKKAGSLSPVSLNDNDGQGSTWGQPLGRQNSPSLSRAGYENISARFNGVKLRQQDLQGRYDVPGWNVDLPWRAL